MTNAGTSPPTHWSASLFPDNLWQEFKANRRPLVEVAVWTFLAGISEAALLSIIAFLAADVGGAKPDAEALLQPLIGRADSLKPTFAVAFGLVIARGAFQILGAVRPVSASGDLQRKTRQRLISGYLNTPWTSRVKFDQGDLQELAGEHTSQRGTAMLHLANLVAGLMLTSTLLVAAFILSVRVALLVSAFGLILFGMMRPLARVARVQAALLSSGLMQLARRVQQMTQASLEVSAYGVEEQLDEDLGRIVSDVDKQFRRSRALTRAVPMVYQVGAIALVIAGLWLLRGSRSSVVDLGAVVLLLVRASSYGQMVQASYQGYHELRPYADRIKSAVAEMTPRVTGGGRPLARVVSLEMREAGLVYPDGTVGYQGITFRWNTPGLVGIIGRSGAGKSTLMRSLLGVHGPTCGEYLVNEFDYQGYFRADWVAQFGYVPQRPMVVPGTVAENVAFYRSCTMDEIVEACRLSSLHEEIERTGGYDRRLDSMLGGMSGGQLQRLSIARALVKGPSVLLLDEPTSALDWEAEARIATALQEISRSHLVVVIAHRGSVVDFCEHRLELEKGKLVPEGWRDQA